MFLNRCGRLIAPAAPVKKEQASIYSGNTHLVKGLFTATA